MQANADAIATGKQAATSAFQLFGAVGSPADPKIEDYREDLETYRDLHAVAVVLSILQDEGKDIVVDAVRQIYIEPFEENVSRKRVIDDRVIRFSVTRYVSVRSVYRYLLDARRLFASVRFPGKFV